MARRAKSVALDFGIKLMNFFKKIKSKKWARLLTILFIIFIIIILADKLDLTRRITRKSMEISTIKKSEIAVIGQVKRSGVTAGPTGIGFFSFTLQAEKYLKGTGPDEIFIPLPYASSPLAPEEGTRLVAFLSEDEERGDFKLSQLYGCSSGFIILDNEKSQKTIKYVEKVIQGKTLLSFVANYFDLPIFYVCI